MAQVQDKLKVQREYAIQLLHQLTAEYPTLKPEMKQISEQYPGLDDEYAVLEEFELLVVSIFGYAKQIETTGNVKHLDATIVHLHQLQVFANSTIAQFYAEARGQYQKVQIYNALRENPGHSCRG